MKLRLMIQSVLGSSRKVSTVGSRLFTNTTAKRHASSNSETKKPDLKRAGKDTRASKVIGAACLLVAIYMYPMIFKPLLGIGETDDNVETSKELQSKLSQHRPSNMPEWTSPFGPRKESEE